MKKLILLSTLTIKKLILILTLCSVLFSCSNGGNTSSSNNNNNSNSFTNSMDYEFIITINGEIHKVKGNTTNGIPKGSVNNIDHSINNECEVDNLTSTTKLVML
jgi:hypothetical protein